MDAFSANTNWAAPDFSLALSSAPRIEHANPEVQATVDRFRSDLGSMAPRLSGPWELGKAGTDAFVKTLESSAFAAGGRLKSAAVSVTDAAKTAIGRVIYNPTETQTYDLGEKIAALRGTPIKEIYGLIRNNEGAHIRQEYRYVPGKGAEPVGPSSLGSGPPDGMEAEDVVFRMFAGQGYRDPNRFYERTGKNSLSLNPTNNPATKQITLDFMLKGAGGAYAPVLREYKSWATPTGIAYMDNWDIVPNEGEALSFKDRVARTAVSKITTPIKIEGEIPWSAVRDNILALPEVWNKSKPYLMEDLKQYWAP